MTTAHSLNLLAKLAGQLTATPPFSLLPESVRETWLERAEVRKFPMGRPLVQADELPDHIFIVVQGEVRLLGRGLDAATARVTLERRGKGQLVGIASLLRGAACEQVIASSDVLALAIPSEQFVAWVLQHQDFGGYFQRTANLQEAYEVARLAAETLPQRSPGWEQELLERAKTAKAYALSAGQPFEPPVPTLEWYVSTPELDQHPVGTRLLPGARLPDRPGFRLPFRLVGLPASRTLDRSGIQAPVPSAQPHTVATEPSQLDQLGIVEADHLDDSYRYPIVKGRGRIGKAMAVIEMLALQQNVPFRRDYVVKVLEDQFRRDKGLTLELMAGLCELLGLHTQLAEVETRYIANVESPALLLLDETPVILYGFARQQTILGHPAKGLLHLPAQELAESLGERFRFVIPRRVAATPVSRFGWGWFTPLLRKYRLALMMVFLASLLAQLFGLAVPLLIQQIIDKVLTQGNLSSLNILGTAMIIFALMRGILTALRTYIFVDTTDRMDLTLGSAVIDRLLSLPLSFFEKRSVGELSQRLGELNTIRSFLTGTALISVLNLIFATAYLVVMLIYSPLLTGVALSIMPIYLLLVFGVAPIYKGQIRERAVAQARTQSHLIEVLGGIQTVKAQHFELTSRWKWQDRYRKFVEQGFKSTVLGATASEIGNFLNQLSGLLVLWVGMWMVLKGEFTLGMLIAFRIIAGNVSGPLLQLSGLYQGFQGVQLAMERLGDILDQRPETGDTDNTTGQIALPPIQGGVRFESVSFRFKDNGPYQVNNLSAQIAPGSFVGIVGQSGSGKSTLMKLLPRLYDLELGRIYIDDFDIAKVDISSLRRQIGIVPQDSLLFEGSIAENIALNDPQASDEAIITAAKIACAHDFIMGLGQGYATQVAERGSNLSGGQRQRIAIARTILSNPRMLVMDEATSALDFNTERQLCENLQGWAHGRTVFFITHRLSTVRNSSLILVMHEGRLIESGTHQELVDQQGFYSALYRQQEQ